MEEEKLALSKLSVFYRQTGSEPKQYDAWSERKAQW
jgi:hypothetical protein